MVKLNTNKGYSWLFIKEKMLYYAPYENKNMNGKIEDTPDGRCKNILGVDDSPTIPDKGCSGK